MDEGLKDANVKIDHLVDTMHGPPRGNPDSERVSKLGLVDIALSTRDLVHSVLRRLVIGGSLATLGIIVTIFLRG